MTMKTSTYQVTNLAAGLYLNLSVAQGADPLAAARAHLADSPLSEVDRQGCFLSLYPSDSTADDADLVLG